MSNMNNEIILKKKKTMNYECNNPNENDLHETLAKKFKENYSFKEISKDTNKLLNVSQENSNSWMKRGVNSWCENMIE